MTSTSHLTGLIFDLDGTLADTALDFPQMCHDAGLPVGTKILEHCEQLNDPTRVAEILSVVEQHELAGAKRARWILDAEKVLHQLSTAGIPIAIVTRNMRRAAKLTIERLNIPIELVITREDCPPQTVTSRIARSCEAMANRAKTISLCWRFSV